LGQQLETDEQGLSIDTHSSEANITCKSSEKTAAMFTKSVSSCMNPPSSYCEKKTRTVQSESVSAAAAAAAAEGDVNEEMIIEVQAHYFSDDDDDDDECDITCKMSDTLADSTDASELNSKPSDYSCSLRETIGSSNTAKSNIKNINEEHSEGYSKVKSEDIAQQ